MIIAPPTPVHLLPHTVTITNYVWAADSTSATPAVASSVTATVQGFVQPQTGQDALMYGRETGTLGYDVYLRPIDINGVGIAVKHSDTITHEGITLRITSVQDAPCSLGTLLHVVAEVVK